MSQAVATETPEFSGSSIRDAIQAYLDAGNPMGVPHIEIATWIVNNDLFDVPFETKVKQCDKIVKDALQSVHRLDPQGRSIRKFVAYQGPWQDPDTGKKLQKWLWADAFECSQGNAHSAMIAVRKSIGKDVNAYATLVASMNQNNPNLRDNPIQLDLDFTGFVDGDPKKTR